MIKGIFTIEIENKVTGKKRTVVKENAINPYYKKMFDTDIYPEYLMIADTDFYPMVGVDGSINVPDYVWYIKQYVSNIRNPDGKMAYTNVLAQLHNMQYKALTKDSSELTTQGRSDKYKTDYFDGSFTLSGLITNNCFWQLGGCGFVSCWGYDLQRMFSCLDVTPNIEISEEEKVKFNYEIIQEW